MKQYDVTPEEIKDKARKLIADLTKSMKAGGFSSLTEMISNSKHLRDPDIICRNCGRIVFVGKCCATPDIVERGELSPEALQQVYALTEQKAQPTNALTELMKRGKK